MLSSLFYKMEPTVERSYTRWVTSFMPDTFALDTWKTSKQPEAKPEMLLQ